MACDENKKKFREISEEKKSVLKKGKVTHQRLPPVALVTQKLKRRQNNFVLLVVLVMNTSVVNFLRVNILHKAIILANTTVGDVVVETDRQLG